ncbi:MAG TPA: TIGR01777 family oxidoreductase [Candidatus Krumholzibacteria bacterium]|nr:TIGR01777 family oxidoreductase [Candidatus Krumholzibacteria bacterium]
MQVLVTGASGLLGSALAAALREQGHGVRRLGRGGDVEHVWDPRRGILAASVWDGIEAVAHLAGESVAGFWTPSKKRAIHDSRVLGTKLLCESLAASPQRPRLLLSASAVGFYGDRADAPLTEEDEGGTGFLAETCLEWEGATVAAETAGMRVVRLRFGVVLARGGGMLKPIVPLFRCGLGGRLGDGRQFMSWIALEDAVAAMLHALATTSLRGAVNVVALEPVTNAEFTRTLARVLHRPALLPAPAFALRFLLGAMADDMLLASARVLPRRLLDTGFRHRHPVLEEALRAVLQPSRARAGGSTA